MPFVEMNYKAEEKAIKELERSSTEARQAGEAFEAAYELHKKMIEARRKSGLTQAELAVKMGATQQSVSRFENGSSGNLGFAINYACQLGYKLELVKA